MSQDTRRLLCKESMGQVILGGGAEGGVLTYVLLDCTWVTAEGLSILHIHSRRFSTLHANIAALRQRLMHSLNKSNLHDVICFLLVVQPCRHIGHHLQHACLSFRMDRWQHAAETLNTGLQDTLDGIIEGSMACLHQVLSSQVGPLLEPFGHGRQSIILAGRGA